MEESKSLNAIQGTWEENIEGFGDGILAYWYVEDVERDFVEKIAYYLIDERSSVVSRRQSPHICGKYKLLQYVSHGRWISDLLLFLK